MKPIASRIADYTTASPVETSALEVYRRVLWMLDEERRTLESAVWAPRIGVRKWRRLHSQHSYLTEVIAIVTAMRDRHTGVPIAPPKPRPRPPSVDAPDIGYGER